jgi:hypothetical protein
VKSKYEHPSGRAFRPSILILIGALAWGLTSCGTVGTDPAFSVSARNASADKRTSTSPPPPASERPGLGTMWGEERESKVETTYFVRARKSRPLTRGSAFYNDEEGAKAMLVGRSFDKGWGPETLGDGLVTFGLQDSSGSYLSSYRSSGDRIFVGKTGQRYTIVARNLTSSRLEVVFSVDGLDAIDGAPAAYSKRGYVLAAGEKLKVSGFRKNNRKVHAFRFGPVSDSYAEQRHGNTRNVGVVGIAVFHEQGSRPKAWSHTDMGHRFDADPFPESSRFATPPPEND